MAESRGEDVTSQQTESKLGLTTFTFRSQRYQIPSVIVKEKTPDDPTGEEHMCVMLDVGLFCPHCNGPCKELLGAHGHHPTAHGSEFGDGYHSLERQVRRGPTQTKPPPPQQGPPGTDRKSLQETLAQAMGEQSQTHSKHSASQPIYMGHGPHAGSQHSQHSTSERHHHREETSSQSATMKTTTISTQHQHQQQQQRVTGATDSPQFTVRHSVKQSSASYSTSSPVTKPKMKPKPGVKPRPQVSNLSQMTSSESRTVTSEKHVSHPDSMPRSDYGSMDKSQSQSQSEDVEVAPLESVGHLIKRFSSSDEASLEAQIPTSPKAKEPVSPKEAWQDQRGAAKFLNDMPSTRLSHPEDRDREEMLRAFGFEVISQAPKRKGQDNASREVASKVTKVETTPFESVPMSRSSYDQHKLAPPTLDDYQIQVSDDGMEEDLIQELLNDEEITSEEDSSFRNEFLEEGAPSSQYKQQKTVIPSRMTNELSGSSDVLSVDSETSEEGIGLEKDILGDSFIGSLSEQPMLHESSPEAQAVPDREHKQRYFKRTGSGSSDDLDDVMLSSGIDASEGDESPRSLSPEIDLDIALESAETEVFSGDATLGRVFSVRSEKRQYSLVKVYSPDKRSKSRDKRSKASSSSSMENIVEEDRTEKRKDKHSDQYMPSNKDSPGPSTQQPQWPGNRQPSPETVFENIIENLETSGVDWTSDYESDQKDDGLSGGAMSPGINGVTDTSVDNEIKSLDFLGAEVGARRTSSCECVVDHLTQDTESSFEPVGSSTGTREDSADFSDSDSDGSDPNLLDPGGKSVEQIINKTRNLTDSLLTALDKTGLPEPELKAQEPPVETEKPPPVPKRTYIYCETSFVGDDRPSSQVSADSQQSTKIPQSPQKSPKMPDMDRIYRELSEREKKRESPPKEQESHLKITKKEQIRTQEMLSSYDEICAPKSPVIHRTPVYAKIQRLPQFLAEEFSHTITNTGEAMELESERMRAEQYQNYQQEIEKRIPDIEVSAVPSTSTAPATREESIDSTDIDAEFEDNLRVCSQRKGGGDVSSDLGSIMDGIDGATTPEPHAVAETDQMVPETMEEKAKPEVLKHAYQAAKYVTKLVDNTTLKDTEVAEDKERTTTEVVDGQKTTKVDNWNRSTSDASTNVTSFNTKDSLTKEQAQEFIQMMMGKKSGKDQDIQASLSQVCETSSNKQVVPSKDEEVKSEEITTQEVTLVFSWPQKTGMPTFPKMENPFREILLHRVTRITDLDSEVIEGPTMETIEYGKSKGKISGVEYERQRSLKGTAVHKARKALPPSTVKVMSKTERSTQSDVLTSHTSKFATDVEEVTIVSCDDKVTTIATQTVPARYINLSKTELSLGAIKSHAESAGITVDATSTVHTENIAQPEEEAKPDKETGRAEAESTSVATTSEVVHELTSRTTSTTTTTVVTTALSNDPAREGMAGDACAPSSAAVGERPRSSSSGSSQSGSTGSVVDLHAQRTTMEFDEEQYEETFPSQEELENVVEQQEVPPRFSETVGFSTSRDMNKAKVDTPEDTTVVEEFFHKSPEHEVRTFCEQYTRDGPEREGSEQSEDIEDALEGMQVVYPRDPASVSDKPEPEPSVEHVEIRNVSTQHIMQSLQKRMETLGYDFPMPDFGEDSSNAKEQHLDIVWTEQEKSILEDAIHSSNKPSEVKPKEVYEIDGRQFFTSASSVGISLDTETKTKTEVKDVPLLTKVRLIAYMSDAERDLIKSLIEFCRIIEQLGDQKTSGRTLDVIPEGLELTVEPGVSYSDCLPSPESRKLSQLHSPCSVNDNSAEKAFEDTLAVIEKTKQFVNDTDFTKPGTPTKPLQNGLRDSRTPSTDDDMQSAQCTRILELERSEQEVSDSSEDAAPGSAVRRVSVSGLYRDLIDVVMPLKTEKNITHCLTTETRSITEVTAEKHSKTSNVIYETSFVGQRTDGVKPIESKPTNDTDTVSTVRSIVSTTAHGSQVLHVPSTSEHGQDMSSVTVSADICSAAQPLFVEQSHGVKAKGTHDTKTSPHHIPPRKDMNVDMHAILIQPSGVVKQETLTVIGSGPVSPQKPEPAPTTVGHYADQITDDAMNTALGEMSRTRIALVDRENRVQLQREDQGVTSPKKIPPPVPPRRGRRPPPLPPKPDSRKPDSKEHLQPMRPVFNGGPYEPRDSNNKNEGDAEEKLFLVRSDEGNKYVVESPPVAELSGDARASAEAQRASTDAARRAFFSDIAIEKLALVKDN